VRYKDRSLRPVRLQQFLEDGEVYWSAEDDQRGHLISGWSTRAEIVEIVDQSTRLRFCDFTVIIHKLHRDYRVPFHVGSVQAIRQGYCIGGCPSELKVWLHIAEGKEYVTISDPNTWVNHRHRENLDLFRAEAAVFMPIPQSDAEYRALHKKINTEILF
jgi:hypothetical protein